MNRDRCAWHANAPRGGSVGVQKLVSGQTYDTGWRALLWAAALAVIVMAALPVFANSVRNTVDPGFSGSINPKVDMLRMHGSDLMTPGMEAYDLGARHHAAHPPGHAWPGIDKPMSVQKLGDR